MSRECWVYPENGGEPYLRGSRPEHSRDGYPSIMPDLPDFVSPIDQKTYSGRAGMREHNRIHDVVPTADLAGLPIMRAQGNKPTLTRQEAAARKERLIHIVNQHWK